MRVPHIAAQTAPIQRPPATSPPSVFDISLSAAPSRSLASRRLIFHRGLPPLFRPSRGVAAQICPSVQDSSLQGSRSKPAELRTRAAPHHLGSAASVIAGVLPTARKMACPRLPAPPTLQGRSPARRGAGAPHGLADDADPAGSAAEGRGRAGRGRPRQLARSPRLAAAGRSAAGCRPAAARLRSGAGRQPPGHERGTRGSAPSWRGWLPAPPRRAPGRYSSVPPPT